MTPAMVHLNAQLVRNARGMCTAFEKWAAQQPPSPTVQDIRESVAAWRGMLDLVERQLSLQTVDAPVARPG